MRPAKAAVIIAVALLFAMRAGESLSAGQPLPGPRLIILMVWDGLRPDSVTKATTPNLYALAHRGVYFAHSHSIFPTDTMVNAAVLATDTLPGANYVWGDSVYLAPYLPATPAPATDRDLAMAQSGPIDLESSTILTELGARNALDGHLIGAPSLGALLIDKGAMVAIVGKAGPTFLFDSEAAASTTHSLLISDDMVRPRRLTHEFHLLEYPNALKMPQWDHPPFASRDTYFAHAFSDHLLPEAVQTLKAGHDALLILWQHNPDITEHRTGIGTAESLQALRVCDANLGYLLNSINDQGLKDRTDLIVLSDHGFATIKARVPLAELLVAKGLKLAPSSSDVIVVSNGASDQLFLSPVFSEVGRRRRLQKIVDFVERQDWCGPVLSRPKRNARPDDYRGEIAGTLSEARLGLAGPRSPDLVISFRELPDQSNLALTGPMAPAYVIAPGGSRTVPNHSQPAAHPLPGAVYADVNPYATTGLGTHGALGERELHNFCAAIGPDFRRAWVDQSPTSNLDAARTIARLVGLPGRGGRVMAEAMADGKAPGTPSHLTLRTILKLAHERVITEVTLSRLDGEDYLDGASVRRVALHRHQAGTAVHHHQ